MYIDICEKILFPACAGVILKRNAPLKLMTTFPRVCGGDPEISKISVDLGDFSPRVRG